MSNDLKILITGTLNPGATIGSINTAIKGIEKKISKLKLKVEIDQNVLKTLTDFNKQMQQIAKTAANTQKVVESALLPDGTKVTRTFFDGMHKGFQQTLDDAKRVGSEMKNTTSSVESQIKSVKDLTTNYSKLANEAKKYNKDGSLKSKASTYLNDQGNARIINTDQSGKVQNYRDINNFAAFEKQQQSLRKELIELARQGKYTTEELRKIGQGINLSTSIKQLDQMKLKMSNLKMGSSLKAQQEELVLGFKKLFDQGRITENRFKNFNNIINSARNVKEIQKIQAALERVSSSTTNKALQQKLLTDSQTLLRTHSKTVDKTALNELINGLKQIRPNAQNASNQLKQLESQLKSIQNASREAARSSMTMMDAFKTALVKYPVWLGATSIFIGIPRLVNAAIDTIVDLDSKLVQLKKVMSDDTNFDQIMARATDSAREFAKTLSETMDTYIEFSKQGYSQEEIPLLADAALVTSNVGEMAAGQSAQYLTSALVQMKLEAKDAMSVIDSWNNVSNKNATTVEKLAQGYSRAAAVSKTWNLDMHELNAIIGTVTAATKQSGNEVGNFVKNVLPRLTSKPAQAALDMVGVSMTDESGNLKDALQIYREVAKEYQKLDQLNKVIVAEGLAGKFHISRLSALLDNFSMVDKILQDSQNSSNSARIENEKYMMSLEARISKTKQSFEELALIIGKAFLTESFVQFLDAMKGLANIAATVTNGVGALPVIFGGVASAAILMSKGFRTAVVEMNIMNAASRGLSISVASLGVAFKAMLASTGVGVVFFGIGFALEKLISGISKSRQEMEEFERKNKELMLSFKENRDSIASLTEQYMEYEKKINSGQYTTDDLEKYTELTDKLANAMPSLVIGEDQYGNKILASSEFIKAKTEQLEKQLAIQEKIDAREQKETAQKDYNTAKDGLKEYKKEQKDLLEDLNTDLLNNAQRSFSGNPFIFEKDIAVSSIDEIIKKIDELEKKRANGDISGSEQRSLDALKNTYNSYDMLSSKIEESKMTLQSASQQMVDSIVNADEEMSASAKSLTKDFAIFVSTSEASTSKIDKTLGSLGDKLETDSNLKSVLEDYAKAIDTYRDKLQEGLEAEDLEKYQNKAIASFENVKAALLDIAKSNNLDDGSYAKLSAQLDRTSNSALNLNTVVESLSKSTGKSKDELMAELALTPQLSDEMGSLADSSYDASEGQEALATAAEKVVGVSENSIQQTQEMAKVYQLLSGQQDLNESQTLALAEATNYLRSTYPHLIKGSEMNIDAMLNEARTNNVLIKAVEAAANGQLTAQQESTLASALNTKARIENIKAEVKAQKTLLDSYSSIGDNYKKLYEEGKISADDYARAMMRVGNLSSKPFYEIDKATAELDSLSENINTTSLELAQIPAISDKVNDSTSKLTNSTEKANKATEESIYITDVYKQKLEAVRLELEKQQAIKAKFPTYSKQYQTALKNEISLMEKQKKLIQDQAKSLEKQIKSGNIIQPGISTTSSSSVSTASTMATGSSTAAQIWNFFKSKGFSDNIVAGIMGNLKLESGLNPNAINKSSGATGIAQWLGGRKSALSSYAGSMGTSMYDLNTQLNFLWKELNSTEKRTMSYLSANQNASAAQVAAMFDKLFERSEGTHIPQRQAYANQFLSQFSGTGVSVSASSTVSDTSKAIAEQMQSIDGAKSDLLQLQQDIISINEQIAQLQYESVLGVISILEKRIADADYLLSTLELKQNDYDVSSQSYRNVLRQRSDALYQRQRANASEINYVESIIKKGGLDPIKIAELTDKLRELRLEREQMFEQQEEFSGQITDSYISAFADQLENIGNALTDTQSKIQNLDKSSADYRKAVADEVAILDERTKTNEQYIKTLEHVLKVQKLSVEKQKEIKQIIEDTTRAIKEDEYARQDIIRNLADEGIEVLKSAIEKRRDIEVAAIRNELEEAEKAHEQRMEMYDEDLSKFEDTVRRKMDLIDSQYEEDNFNRNLSKLQTEEQDIRNRINVLMLDNSQNAIAKRLELEKQLKDIQEQIEQQQRERENKLRKDSLQEELDKYKEEIEGKKEAEDEKLDTAKESADKEVDAIEYKYNELLANERYFAEVRKQIMSGNYDYLQNQLMDYLDFFRGYNEDTIRDLGLSWQGLKNDIDSILNSSNQFNNIKTGGSNSGTNDATTSAALKQYLENKRMVESGTGVTAERLAQLSEENNLFRSTYGFKDGSYFDLLKQYDPDAYKRERDSAWHKYLNNKRLAETGNPTAERAAQLKSENDTLRNRWSFPDGRYNDLKSLTKYHDGGVVGGKSNRITELVSKLFNGKPNEQAIMALKGELYAPQKNMPNFFNNLKNLMPPTPMVATPIGLNINIENFHGTKQEVTKLGNDISALINNMKNRGKI